MKPLAPDEKTALVMIYTHNMLVRGEVVTKESSRVSIWLRTQGVPNYIHLIKPQVILYDEPTTGVDPIGADAINRLIIRLHDRLKVTGVVVTHDMVSAYKIADRIAMLHEGRILQVGAVKEIQQTSNPVVRNFILGISENGGG